MLGLWVLTSIFGGFALGYFGSEFYDKFKEKRYHHDES